MEKLFFKFILFSFVGLLGMVVDFGVTYVCKEHFKWQKYFANTAGFSVAVCVNYMLNRFWTFASNNPNIGKEFSAFVFVSIIGLAINNGILLLVHQHFKVSFYYAKVVAIGVTVIWNFFSNLCFTFNESYLW